MTAALTQPQAVERHGDGLQPTNFVRDLRGIAELIELCFAPQMDTGGRAAVNEMKALSYLWPLAWLLALLDRVMPGLGAGFVWRSEGRVVGNASLYRAGNHPELGPGWLVANVAVHPDYRRRGIARAMVDSVIDLVRQRRGRWIALEVEAANEGAQALYRSVGYQAFETLTQWETISFASPAEPIPNHLWREGIHLRMPGETSAEAELIFRRARRGAMAWTHPIERHDLWDSLFDGLDSLFRAAPKEHWLMDDPHSPNRLIGSLWVETSGWRQARLSLFLDPVIADPEARQSLLQQVLDRAGWDGWSLRIETVADDQGIDDLLIGKGFRRTRSLTQMRLMLE